MTTKPSENPDRKDRSGPALPPFVAVGLRIVLPLALVVIGVLGYRLLSEKPPAPPAARPAPKPIEVRVLELAREDYQVRVATQGAIRAHSQVSLTAQVAGRIQLLHPSFEEGAFFKEGEVLLELDPVDFETARIASRAQVAQAKLALEQEEARAEQSRLDWEDLGLEGEPSELVLRIPQLDAARRNLELAESQLAAAERSLERSRVRAPFDGRVLGRSAGVGQTIGAATPLGEIFATDYSEVRLPVSTRHLADLSLPEDVDDPPLEIHLRDGLAEDAPGGWDARILRTEGALDASTLELFAIARIEDPFGLQSEKSPLRIGQPVVTEIPGRIIPDVFVIPREAVTGLNRIRLVDPGELKLSSAMVTPVWSDEEFLVFQSDAIEDGTLLVLTKLVYAPDGASVVLVEEEGAELGATVQSGMEGRDGKGGAP